MKIANLNKHVKTKKNSFLRSKGTKIQKSFYMYYRTIKIG
jgi:hypothetical protein